MRLTDEEKAMLDGKQGPARQKALELLIKYGEALVSVVSKVPAMTEFDKDPLDIIKTGDCAKVDADSGFIEITRED